MVQTEVVSMSTRLLAHSYLAKYILQLLHMYALVGTLGFNPRAEFSLPNCCDLLRLALIVRPTRRSNAR